MFDSHAHYNDKTYKRENIDVFALLDSLFAEIGI